MAHSRRSRVVVAMSGGVDSSVAAAALVEAGHECIGVFMRHASPVLPAPMPVPLPAPLPVGTSAAAAPLAILPDRPGHQGCCSPTDALDVTPDFERIIDSFATEYGRGRTPNPCVRCNSWVKFGRLYEHADSIGATHIATGHYARLDHGPGGPVLSRGHERARDQSYVLFDIRPDRLARMLLPVGHLPKPEVRARALALGLVTADKPDSQEICFVAPGEHARLVAHRLGGSRAGEIVDGTGRVLGRHPGIEHFTVGQRQGLGIAVGVPLYVIRIEPDTCRIVVGPRAEVPETELLAAEVTWLVEPPTKAFECLVQCRAQRGAAAAIVTPLGGDRFAARFTGGPDHSPGPISPGQPAVCYAGDRVLGGGWIVG